MTVPQRIGRLHVVRRLGSGGFGTVWLARDPDLDALVAVKVLADNFAARADLRERFVSEARLLRRVDSDRLVRVWDIGELADGRPWFSMTYADRGCLADRLPWRGSSDDALAVLAAVAEGAATLHEHGIVHRDLTPANVLFASSTSGVGRERILVSDLGIAKDLGFASGLTQPAGTGDYRAPEQREYSSDVGPASDVFALARLARDLLGPMAAAPAVAAVIGAASEPDPSRRTADVRAFFGELTDALADGGFGVPQAPRVERGQSAGSPPGVAATPPIDVPRTLPGAGPTPPAGDRVAAAGGATRRTRSRPTRRAAGVAGAAALALLAAGVGTYRAVDHTALAAPDGSATVRLPGRGWAQAAALGMPGTGAEGRALSRDGVVVELARTREGHDAARVAAGRQHGDCGSVSTRSARVGRWTGTVFTWAGCPGGVERHEVGLGSPAEGTAYVRVETPPGGLDLATVLGGLEPS